jgi:hypothetical protein
MPMIRGYRSEQLLASKQIPQRNLLFVELALPQEFPGHAKAYIPPFVSTKKGKYVLRVPAGRCLAAPAQNSNAQSRVILKRFHT